MQAHFERSKSELVEARKLTAVAKEDSAAAKTVVERWKRERENHRREVAEARAAVREKEMEAYALRRRLRRLGGMGKKYVSGGGDFSFFLFFYLLPHHSTSHQVVTNLRLFYYYYYYYFLLYFSQKLS